MIYSCILWIISWVELQLVEFVIYSDRFFLVVKVNNKCLKLWSVQIQTLSQVCWRFNIVLRYFLFNLPVLFWCKVPGTLVRYQDLLNMFLCNSCICCDCLWFAGYRPLQDDCCFLEHSCLVSVGRVWLIWAIFF